MEISKEKLQELTEASYMQGQRGLLLSQLGSILQQLGIKEDTTREQQIAELEESRLALRSICRDHGDNNWDDNLYLPDVINKHLGCYLYD